MKNEAFSMDVDTRLWIPGVAAGDVHQRAVAKAVKEYDESFNLARHELTGDWVVVIGENGHPVFGFGRDLPNPRDVERILGEKDIRRHGARMLDALNREADRKRAVAQSAMDDATSMVAENMEHGFRKEGRHPRPRIFVP